MILLPVRREQAGPKTSNLHNALDADRGFVPRGLSYACQRPKLFTEADCLEQIVSREKAARNANGELRVVVFG